VLKCPDDSKNRVVSAQATYTSGGLGQTSATWGKQMCLCQFDEMQYRIDRWLWHITLLIPRRNDE
jgi:hypothetical protein